jgi:hypothetical protein
MTEDDKRILDYHARLRRVQDDVRSRGRGTQQELSYDLRVSQAGISTLVNGRWVDEPTLARVEQWLREHPVTAAPQAV